MKRIKCFAAMFTAAALLLTSGCSEAEEDAAGINGSEIVAYIENPPEDAGDRFDITYEEWYSEYCFRMARLGYTEEDYPDVAESYRESIIEYLIQERVVLYLAEQMGITADTLTDEELQEIEDSVYEDYLSWCESFETDAIEELGDTYTDDELYNKEFELFAAFLAESGLVPEIFMTWQTNAVIQDKFIAAVSETISDEDVSDFVQETIDTAKEIYETDIATYESSYTAFYIPEGTRIVQQIFVMIDEDITTEVTAYRNDGDDEKADEILNAALEEVRFRIDEAYEKLQNGEDWYEVQAEYNDDTNGDDVDYTVYPKSSYVAETVIQAVQDIEEIGGYSEIITSDSGFFILYYKEDAVFTDEAMQDLLEQAREYLEDLESYNRVLDFEEQYPYVLNYELLNIEAEDEASDEDEETDEDSDEASDEE